MSNYVFRGVLTGVLCDDCREPLSSVTVRLYRLRANQDAVRLAVADPKQTFRRLDAEEVAAKQGALLAEVETDATGAFRVELGEKEPYGGEAFEVDVLAGTMPGRRERRADGPVQFSITAVQPQWRDRERVRIAAWDYAIPQRFWCFLRALFDAWMICGRVTVCGTKQPAAGVRVLAFDRDWLRDDPLGSGITDGDGRFRIDYSGADFRKGTLLDVELFGGPDVYFRVESASGEVLLDEPSSRGRAPDRENIGPCFCADLCVDEAPIVRQAWFTRVGHFNINSDISTATGLTIRAMPFGFPNAHGGPGYGFGGNLKLVGDCPTTHPSTGQPMRYRFRVRPTGSAAAPTPITGGAVLAMPVGSRPVPWSFTGTVQTYAQDIIVAPSGGYTGPLPAPLPTPSPVPAGPWGPIPPLVLSPDADGWVTMPPDATNQGFSGPLLLFASSAVVPGGAPPDDGPGNPVSPANQRNGTDLEIIFEAEPVAGGGPGLTLSNSLPRIHINNWLEAARFELVQFTLPGATPCSGITTGFDLRYTVDHELIAGWKLDISSSATFPPPGKPVLPGLGVPPVPPEVAGPRGGHGTHHVDTTAWEECAYAITFSRSLKLTDGELDDPGRAPMVALFCKRSP